MTHDEYRSINALNASAIKVGRVSMLHMRHAITHPTTATDAMKLGTLIHCAVLEPGELDSRYVVWEGGRRAGKEWAAFAEDAETRGLEVVTSTALHVGMTVAASIRANKRAVALLEGAETERALFWEHPEIGPCKARLDAIAATGELADIKTCRDIASFTRQFERHGHDLQAGWYRDGWRRTTGQRAPAFWLIVAETEAPFDVAVWRVPEVALQAGLERAEAIAKRYRECEATGEFPGIQDSEEMPLPDWYAGPETVDLDNVMPMEAGDL